MERSDKSAPPVRARRRGRPPSKERDLEKAPYREQQIWLKARESLGLSQPTLARMIGLSPSYLQEIETGYTRFNADTLAKFQSNPEMQAYVTNGTSLSLPISFTLGDTETSQRAGPKEMEVVPIPRRRRDLVDCLAIEVPDDSADKDFAAETVLYVRPVRAGDPLSIGQPVVARFRQPGNNHEQIIYGIVDRAVTGDLVLITRSHNLRLPASRMLQSGSTKLRTMPQRILDCIPRQPSFMYEPHTDDPGEVIGVVVYALGPV